MFEVLKQSYRILRTHGADTLPLIELCGRIAYRSDDKITPCSAAPFAERIIRLGHESVIEHSSLTVEFLCSRAITHELVRHRLASFTQESQRYCDYTQFPAQFILPYFLDDSVLGIWDAERLASNEYVSTPATLWLFAMSDARLNYINLRSRGLPPQAAREVLPNSCAARIAVTANLREWRHIFRLRTAGPAHPSMRSLMTPLLVELQSLYPSLFSDIIPFKEECNDNASS